jgi:glycosyltransferase involved in cell wall biosynthesis
MFLARTVVLIPALNEAASINQTVQQWRQLGAARVRVVDNGSADITTTLAANGGAEVVHEPQRGYGAAAWRGLQDWPTDCEWVLFSSADGSDRLSTEDVPAWQDAVDSGADLIIGDRTTLLSSRRELKLTQRFGNWLCVMAIARGWRRRFRDMGSLRLARRNALERMQLQDRGFGWNVEMQVRAVELSLKIVELPVAYYPRTAGESKISGSLVGTFCAARGILRMVLQLYRLKRAPQRAATTSGVVPA